MLCRRYSPHIYPRQDESYINLSVSPMDFLSGHNFLVYSAYQLPIFTDIHRQSIAANVARYIYVKYTSTNTDLIPRYLAVDDVVVSVNAGIISESNLELSYLTIDHSVTQVVAFLRKDNIITVLVDLPLPLFLIQMLEALDFDTPLILQSQPITSDTIHHVVNSMQPLVSVEAGLLGEINMTFSPQEKLTNDSLREIIVTVPRKDSKRILEKSSSPPLDAILDWLMKITSMKLRNMKAISFDCDLVKVTVGHRITFKDTTFSNTTMATILANVWGKS